MELYALVLVSDTFSDQTSALGIASDTELYNKFAISVADYDNDGYPDIYLGAFSETSGNNYLLAWKIPLVLF